MLFVSVTDVLRLWRLSARYDTGTGHGRLITNHNLFLIMD